MVQLLVVLMLRKTMDEVFYKKGITLVEILIVVIIVGIVASLGIFNFSNVKEDALKKEAFGNLKLIRAAERIYYLEQGEYYIGDTIPKLNNNLRLALPNKSSPDWEYDTDICGCGLATRTKTSDTWYLTTDNENDPLNGSCSGSCP